MDEPTTWYTSDTHFNHKNIIKFANRYKFCQTVDEMNEHILHQWNVRVNWDDTVWHLGDVTFGNFDILGELNGAKKLILGNHDYKVVRKLERYFDIYDRDICIDNANRLVMSHYPIADWPHKFHGYIHLHGHTHGYKQYDTAAVDVGVDCWDLKPIVLDDIRKLIQKRKEAEFRGY